MHIEDHIATLGVPGVETGVVAYLTDSEIWKHFLTLLVEI